MTFLLCFFQLRRRLGQWGPRPSLGPNVLISGSSGCHKKTARKPEDILEGDLHFLFKKKKKVDVLGGSSGDSRARTMQVF